MRRYKNSPLEPETIARIRELRSQGLTNKATAEQMTREGDPVSAPTVHKYSKELDIPRVAGTPKKYATVEERYEAQKRRARERRQAKQEEYNRRRREQMAGETPEEADERRAYARLYYRANVEKYRRYYQQNRDAILAKQKARYAARKEAQQRPTTEPQAPTA